MGEMMKVQNLKGDFLFMDIPNAFDIIIGIPTLHKIKDVVILYLL